MERIYSKRRHLRGLENLRNAIDLVEEFEKEIRKEEIRRVQDKKREEKVEYLKKLKRSWARQKKKGRQISSKVEPYQERNTIIVCLNSYILF